MGFFTDAVLSTTDKCIDVAQMQVGAIEYCSIKAMVRMGEETKDDGVNPVVTEVTSQYAIDDKREFILADKYKLFHLTIKPDRLYNSQVRLERLR